MNIYKSITYLKLAAILIIANAQLWLHATWGDTGQLQLAAISVLNPLMFVSAMLLLLLALRSIDKETPCSN